MLRIVIDHKPFVFDPRSDYLGGCEKAVVNLAIELRNLGHQISVYIPADAVNIEQVEFKNVLFSYSPAVFDHPWDVYVSISHCLRIGNSRIIKIPKKILYMHDNRCWRDGFPNVNSWDRIVGVSNEHVRLLIKNTGEDAQIAKFQVLKSGVGKQYTCNYAQINQRRQKKHLIFAGAIVPEKDIEIVLKAFEILSMQNSDWHLHIAGSALIWGKDDIYQHELQRRFSHLSAKVTWHGLLSFNSLFDLYTTCGIAIISCASTRPDPGPLSAFEAASAGCVTIGAPFGGIPESVYETVWEWNPVALSKKILDCSELDDDIRTKCKKQFGNRDWSQTAQDFLSKVINNQ